MIKLSIIIATVTLASIASAAPVPAPKAGCAVAKSVTITDSGSIKTTWVQVCKQVKGK